jgi:hypothetical protein
MTIKWSGFPSPVDLTNSDIIVGLAGDTINGRFNASSILLKAGNLSGLASNTTSFNTISPLTTKGDFIWFDGTNNARLALGTANQILSVGASSTPTWIDNPALLKNNNLNDLANLTTALANLGLSPSNNVTFNTVIATTSSTSVSFISTGLNVDSFANTITAHVGGGQASATQLTKHLNQVKTVASAGDSVKLPAAVQGLTVIVNNAAAANALDCFPSSGNSINIQTADTALSIVANTTVMFICALTGTWNTIVTA